MFESITGDFEIVDLSSAGLVVDLPDAIDDFYKNWIVTLEYTIAAVEYSGEFTITANTQTLLSFTNSLSLAGATGLSYTIAFITQNLLIQDESDMAISAKVPEALYLKKLAVTKTFFEQKIKAQFRNLYLQYDDVDPLSLIYNLYEIQTVFIYYCIAQIYFDLITEPNDTNELKYNEKMKMFNSLFKDSMSLLSVDLDEDGELSNDELATSAGSGGLLSR